MDDAAADDPPVPDRNAALQTAGMRQIAPPHPSRIEPHDLLRQCDLTMTRRGGPGGQHRNKTSTAVVLHHRPTGISAEASERRSQAANRRVALDRLRLLLAVAVRCAAGPADDQTAAPLRRRYGGGTIRIAESNPDHAAVLALLLDDLVAAEGHPQRVAEIWNSTASQILRMLRTHPPALAAMNRYRAARGQRPLR